MVYVSKTINNNNTSNVDGLHNPIKMQRLSD